MLITFFSIKVIVHSEFIIQGQTVKQAYYVEIFKWLREIRRKRPGLRPNDCILHNDNASALKTLSSIFWPKICN